MCVFRMADQLFIDTSYLPPPISILILIRWIYLGYGRSEEEEKKILLTACPFCAARGNEELKMLS